MRGDTFTAWRAGGREPAHQGYLDVQGHRSEVSGRHRLDGLAAVGHDVDGAWHRPWRRFVGGSLTSSADPQRSNPRGTDLAPRPATPESLGLSSRWRASRHLSPSGTNLPDNLGHRPLSNPFGNRVPAKTFPRDPVVSSKLFLKLSSQEFEIHDLPRREERVKAAASRELTSSLDHQVTMAREGPRAWQTLSESVRVFEVKRYKISS
jgi:hypothetical protein